MGLPKPFGPYNVAFADFELRRTTEIRSGGNLNRSPSSSREHQKNRPDFVGLADAHGAPLMRLFYPTSHQTGKVSNTDFSLFFQKSRRWIPSLMYTWGYVSKLIPPSSALQRFVISILAGSLFLFNLYAWLHTNLLLKTDVVSLSHGKTQRKTQIYPGQPLKEKSFLLNLRPSKGIYR